MLAKSKLAQVLMPIGSDPDYRAKQAVLERAIRSAGLTPSFPDYDPVDPKFDLDGFLSQLRRSTVVVADVTGERPSVYFELGLAQALGKLVLMVAKSDTILHQHARDVRLVRYSCLEDLELKLEKMLLAQDEVGPSRAQ
jgi:hypothetical protein